MIKDPAERRLRAHLEEAPFQIGVAESWWDVVATPDLQWPLVVFWIAAAERMNAPERFHVRLDLTNYSIVPPTGTFWDLTTHQPLATPLRPYGQGQVGRVFRIDWKGGQAFYHPFDRQASRDGHSQWPRQYPHLVWTEKNTVADLLSVLWELLQSRAYEGVRGQR
jgi:hypothetical protein